MRMFVVVGVGAISRVASLVLDDVIEALVPDLAEMFRTLTSEQASRQAGRIETAEVV